MQHNQSTLRRVLAGNTIFSTLSGLLLLLDAEPVSAFLGLDAAGILRIIGAVCLAYAALMVYNLRQPSVDPRFVLFTTIADSVWVLVSVVLLVTGWVPFSPAGMWAVGIVAIIVDVFATLQFLQWWKMPVRRAEHIPSHQ